ncbi:aldehyde dehydrogenase family protein [Opitutus sp. ER46]|uniref:aldehyde dehydrogenase family protein n=1 Tax=Opitutus sp. ER46 TaxID=2161864 RepID=UPI000D313A29|nr:aldehyde dehydrogenase family protein [Opitutus sp. ER46]PTY00666.1 aldehyde dehydrogenase [Opitutus sp. ER46]
MTRLPITKTPKPYVGGAFIRSESGRTFPIQDAAGNFFAHMPQCTRKDLRNAVEAAAKAGPGWARRTAYNRGQILYRLGEMLEARRQEMIDTLGRFGAGAAEAEREVDVAIDRLVYYAGWTDKYEQVLGNVNPVAAPYFNFTVTEPMGVVGVIAPDQPPLLGLITLVAPVIASGNTVVAAVSEKVPYPAILLGEMLATSDLPGGVVNLLTGFRAELVPTFATHEHLRALSVVSASPEERKTIRLGAADSVKRVHFTDAATDWFADEAQSVYAIRAFLEFKTTWHPVGA